MFMPPWKSIDSALADPLPDSSSDTARRVRVVDVVRPQASVVAPLREHDVADLDQEDGLVRGRSSVQAAVAQPALFRLEPLREPRGLRA